MASSGFEVPEGSGRFRKAPDQVLSFCKFRGAASRIPFGSVWLRRVPQGSCDWQVFGLRKVPDCSGFRRAPRVVVADIFTTWAYQGSSKDACCNHLKHGSFSTKTKASHHLQGNVQV